MVQSSAAWSTATSNRTVEREREGEKGDAQKKKEREEREKKECQLLREFFGKKSW